MSELLVLLLTVYFPELIVKSPLTVVLKPCFTVPVHIKFGKAVTVGPLIVEVPVKVTTPEPETVLALFVQFLWTVIPLFIINGKALVNVIELKSIVAPTPLIVWLEDPLKVTSASEPPIFISKVPSLTTFPVINKVFPPSPADWKIPPPLTVTFPETVKVLLLPSFPIVSVPLMFKLLHTAFVLITGVNDEGTTTSWETEGTRFKLQLAELSQLLSVDPSQVLICPKPNWKINKQRKSKILFIIFGGIWGLIQCNTKTIILLCF